MEKEIWKDIPNYEGHYQVSNLGRVRTLKTKHKNNNNFIEESVLLECLINTGYYVVSLSKKCEKKRFLIHRLVWSAFVGFNSNEHNLVIDHINNIKTDNRLCNLQLLTQRANLNKNKINIGAQFNERCTNRKWASKINYKGKVITLGFYKTQQEAMQKYNSTVQEIENNTFIHKPIRNKSSKYKGVTFDKSRKKWMAYGLNGKYIGRFETEEQAYKETLKSIQND
jgi:hypothetical protein